MKQEKLLKYENAKLKQQLIFSIPAGKKVCNLECMGCYAMKFQRLYPNVLPYRERMYDASLLDTFQARIIAEIQACKKPLTAVRIHESGEFYSQAYLDKWHAIATALPLVTFYAFTKRKKDFNFKAIEHLDNFVLIDSLQQGKLNYDKLENLDHTLPICPSTTGQPVTCGVTCTLCMTKQTQHTGMQFKKH